MNTVAAPNRLRIGMLGAANIGRAFTNGCKPSSVVQVSAVASRTQAKADAFAAELGIPRALGSYEALLADPDIDAIYIPLPNSMHAEWAIKACAAGKHVLCEKPLAMDAGEARAMFAAAAKHKVILREAYPYMAQQQTAILRGWLGEGAIGTLKLIRSNFSVLFTDPANIRLIPDLGGGALYDAGSYAVSLIRIVAGKRPLRAHAIAQVEVDGGLLAQVSCSFASVFHRHASIGGDKGVIETNYLNHPPMGGPAVLQIRRGVANTLPMEPVAVPDGNGFRLEAESFAALLRDGDQAWTGATPTESIDILATMDAIRASAKSGRWENLAA